MSETRMSKTRKKRFRPEVNSALCKECQYCREVCETGVFESSGLFNKAGYRYIIPRHAEKCDGCMKCFTICPDFAITVEEVVDILAQSADAADAATPATAKTAVAGDPGVAR
jgi:NAD-dependent dihydropyrimidine dehydrogenase PreA subunit